MKQKLLFLLCLSAKILIAQDIIFRTSVENLRLREQPNLESKVIKTVPKGTRLQWSGIRSEQKITADWKGEKVADYWYKIKTYQDTTAWVFGKGIEFLELNFGKNQDSLRIKVIDNQWIKLEKVDKASFDKQKIFPSQWKEVNQEMPFTLKYDNGESEIFEVDKNDSGTKHDAMLTVANKSYFLMSFEGCMTDSYWLRKSDGKRIDNFYCPIFSSLNGNFQTNGNNNSPVFAPNGVFYANIDACETEENNFCDGVYYYNFNLCTFENDDTKIKYSFEELRVEDFRFITNRSGIAKLRDNSYWKITLKP